jgi:hypothetical protein
MGANERKQGDGEVLALFPKGVSYARESRATTTHYREVRPSLLSLLHLCFPYLRALLAPQTSCKHPPPMGHPRVPTLPPLTELHRTQRTAHSGRSIVFPLRYAMDVQIS